MGFFDMLEKGKKYLDKKQEQINNQADKFREYSTRIVLKNYLEGFSGLHNMNFAKTGGCKIVLLERGFSDEELSEIRNFFIKNGESKTLSHYEDLIK